MKPPNASKQKSVMLRKKSEYHGGEDALEERVKGGREPTGQQSHWSMMVCSQVSSSEHGGHFSGHVSRDFPSVAAAV